MPIDHASDLDYDLPEELIAQAPPQHRGDACLMVLHAGVVGEEVVGRFDDVFLAQLRDDDLIVVNDTAVLRARIRVTRPSGGSGEVLLLEPADGEDRVGTSTWAALARPGRKLAPGMQLLTPAGAPVIVGDRIDERTWTVTLPVAAEDAPFWLDVHGEVPLPPYIAPNGQDPKRYATVYGDVPGSVAAPTAGFHLDESMWRRLRDDHDVATVTLTIGAGTFLPVPDGVLDDHDMHREYYAVDTGVDRRIRDAIARGRRIVAIGTTTVRVLESCYGREGSGLIGSTDLFIRPGYTFGCVGALLTNFHLPRSTLLALVMAFAGEDTVRSAYRRAIDDSMRFYSFGDAMFIHGREIAT